MASDLFLSLFTNEAYVFWCNHSSPIVKDVTQENVEAMSALCRAAMANVGEKDPGAGEEAFKRAVAALAEETINEDWPARQTVMSLFQRMADEDDKLHNCLGWYAIHGIGTVSAACTKILRELVGEGRADEMLSRVISGGKAVKASSAPKELSKLKYLCSAIVDRINELAREHKMETRLADLFREFGIVLWHDRESLINALRAVEERSRIHLGFSVRQKQLFDDKSSTLLYAVEQFENGADATLDGNNSYAREYFLAVRAILLLLEEWLD